MSGLVDRIKIMIPADPELLDLDIDSLRALANNGITWENSGSTRGEMIDARERAVKEYVATRLALWDEMRDALTLLDCGWDDMLVGDPPIHKRDLSSLVKRINSIDNVEIDDANCRDHHAGDA